MATGRTVSRWTRVYYGGVPLSCYTQQIGPLSVSFPTADITTLCDAAKGYLPATPNVSAGTLNGVVDNDTAGLFANFAAAGLSRPMSVAIGIRGEVAAGDPCFNGWFQLQNYQAGLSMDAAATISAELPGWDVSQLSGYATPWGIVSHALSAETGANAAAGIDNAAATTGGGYMVYHVAAGDGTATIKLQDSADNIAWADVASMTSGSIDAAAAPLYGIVAIGKTATIRRYTRWQIVLGTATTVTFFLSLVRG
jgi:hypothetical protein